MQCGWHLYKCTKPLIHVQLDMQRVGSMCTRHASICSFKDLAEVPFGCRASVTTDILVPCLKAMARVSDTSTIPQMI